MVIMLSKHGSCFTKTEKIWSIVACSSNLIMSQNVTFITLGKDNPAEPLGGYTFLPQPLNQYVSRMGSMFWLHFNMPN